MDNQKTINLLNNDVTQLSKFRTKIWADLNNDARETCNTYIQIELNIVMLKSSLCDYSDAYILV